MTASAIAVLQLTSTLKAALTWKSTKLEVDKTLGAEGPLEVTDQLRLDQWLIVRASPRRDWDRADTTRNLTQIIHGEIVASKEQLQQMDERTERIECHVNIV
jgi:hypothetical protein